MAFAIRNMSSSVPAPFKALTAWMTNRELLGVYPSAGTIRSKLGENKYGLRDSLKTNSMPVTSQRPVHRAMAHSGVKLNGMLSRLARCFEPCKEFFQGRNARVA